MGEANAVAVSATGAVVTGGSVAGGLASGGSQAIPKAVAGLLVCANILKGVQDLAQDRAEPRDQSRRETVVILGPQINVTEIRAIAQIHKDAVIKAVDNGFQIASTLRGFVASGMLPSNVSAYESVHEIASGEADYVYALFPDAGGEAVFPSHISRILKEGGVALMASEKEDRRDRFAEELRRYMVVTTGKVGPYGLIGTSNYASGVNYYLVALKARITLPSSISGAQ